MAERIEQQLGNYRLLQLIGEGGFANVYLGEHVHLGTQAAIKVLRTRLVSEGIEQFRHEARTIARLEHPHIVRVLDFGVESGTPFLIISYAPNGTLRQRHPRGTRVPLNRVVAYVKQIASALQYAHEQHVIHRDVKPENLLVGRNNEILLSDFGIALVTQSSHSQHTQDMAGTIAYMAPEQIEAHPCPNSDQYSLAVLTYEWLSGDRPFQGSFTEVAFKHAKVLPPPLHEKEPTLSLMVEQVVLTALAKDPKQRFATVQAFATALEGVSAFEQASRISGQDLLSPSPSVRSSIPSERVAPPRPSTVPAELMTPPIQPAPTTEVVSLSSPSVLPVLAASAEQAVLTQLPTQPSRRGLSRRAVLVGLAGLAGLAVVGGAGTGLARLFRSQALQASSSTPSPVPSPSPSPTSSSTLARSITSSGAMFGFDLQHTHYNSGERILSAANVSHLVLYWTAPTGAAISSSPAVANGIVYIGSNDYNLYAFDATTGTRLWKVPTGNQIHSSPAVANRVVYVGSDDSELYALNATTGKPFWTVPVLTGGAIDSSPTIANGVVYVGSDDYKLHALDATTGQELWYANTYYAINSSPAVSKGIVYIGSPNARLYAFDAIASTSLWSASTGDTINSSPAVANGIVYIGSDDGNLYAFNAANGTSLWAVSTGDQIINSSPAIANGVVYVGSDDGLYAFDAATRKLRWSTLIGHQIRSSPTVANGVVYIGSDDGNLYAFNAITGTILWATLIGHQIRSSPTVANGVVYIGSDDGNLYAFHLPAASS